MYPEDGVYNEGRRPFHERATHAMSRRLNEESRRMATVDELTRRYENLSHRAADLRSYL